MNKKSLIYKIVRGKKNKKCEGLSTGCKGFDSYVKNTKTKNGFNNFNSFINLVVMAINERYEIFKEKDKFKKNSLL